MTPAEVAAVYERAAGEIERRGGIHKGALGADPDRPDACRVCLLGALNVACGYNPFSCYGLPYEVWFPIRDAAGRPPGEWNDAPGTTTDDVTRLLRRLAQRLAPEGSTA